MRGPAPPPMPPPQSPMRGGVPSVTLEYRGPRDGVPSGTLEYPSPRPVPAGPMMFVPAGAQPPQVHGCPKHVVKDFFSQFVEFQGDGKGSFTGVLSPS